jgi:hypothetical protein
MNGNTMPVLELFERIAFGVRCRGVAKVIPKWLAQYYAYNL